MFKVQTDILVAKDDSGPVDTTLPNNSSTGFSTPLNSIYDGPIIVTQTTNYTTWSVGNNNAIQFETSAPSIATFLESQLNNPGQIDSNAEIIGDSNADTVAVDITGPNYYGGWGFQGTSFQFENWTSADKFVINLDGARLPPSTYVYIEGTSGNDVFNMGGYFSYNVNIDGEGGYNTLKLAENYEGNLDSVTNIQQVDLAGGFSYEMATESGMTPFGEALTIDAAALHASDTLQFYANADVSTKYIFDLGAGTNDIYLNSQADIVNCGTGTNDIVDNDGVLSAGVRIVGAGNTTLELSADYSAGYSFSNGSFSNIAQLTLDAGDSYKLTLNSVNATAGHSLTVDASALTGTETLALNGSKVAGNLTIDGGAGNDVLTGGSGSNTFDGGGGADTINCGSGANTFVYAAVTDSTSTGHDTITGFNALTDSFEFQNLLTLPNAIDPTVATGTLSAGNFDVDLAKYVGANQLHAGDAVLFTPTAGNLSGHAFLIIDENGVAGYQAGQDLVIELTGAVNLSHLSIANFEG